MAGAASLAGTGEIGGARMNGSIPRILFLTQTAYAWGGVQSWLDAVTQSMQHRGWDCLVGLARGRSFHDPARFRQEHPALTTVEVDGRGGTRESRVDALTRVLARTTPDIVVPLNLVDALDAAVAIKAAGSARRLVVTVRGFEPNILADLRSQAGWIDFAVGVNRLLTDLLHEWAGIPSERTVCVPSGCPPPAVANADRAPELRLAFVGRLDEREKRALDLVGLVSALERDGTPYRLDVAGDGPCAAQLSAALSRSIAAGRVRLLGKVSVRELYAHVYPRLDALVLFSPAEGSPQAVWQAMHHGVVPVIADFIGRATEGTLRHADTAMVFEVGDVAAAARHLRQLHHDRALLDRLSARGREIAAAHYSVATTMEQWGAAFDRAMELPVRRGDGSVPRRRASGRLARLGLSPRAARVIRALTRRTPVAAAPGDEWPHAGHWPAEVVEAVALRAREHDRRAAIALRSRDRA